MNVENMIVVSLGLCEYVPSTKSLRISVEHFGGRFPSEFFVVSQHTGKVVWFKTVGSHDVLFDHDQWDGEMQIYRPVANVPKVEYLTMYCN